MNIGNSGSTSILAQDLTATTTSQSSVNTEDTDNVLSTNDPQTNTVSISGEALMLSRLFMTNDPNSAPAVLTQLNKSDDSMSPYDFLTEGDRSMLANMYSYAQQQGANPQYVDMVANDLGMYRKYGQYDANMNSGGIFNIKGQMETFSFTAQDTATASSILNGNAIGSTQLDPGFLSYELNPGYSANHGANFQFLEQMVNHFSNAGVNSDQSLGQDFSTFVPNGQQNFVLNIASAVTLNIPQADDASTSSADNTSTALASFAKNLALQTSSLTASVANTLLGGQGQTGQTSSLFSDFLAALQKRIAAQKQSDDAS